MLSEAMTVAGRIERDRDWVWSGLVGWSLEQMDLDDMLKELRRVEGRIMFVLQ